MKSSCEEAPEGLSKRRCRVCFGEDEVQLIAPCLCDGNSKWIHRDCLNKWRASRTNPRALTHCEVCLFQYEIDVNPEIESGAEERRRHLVVQLLFYTFLWFVGIHVIVFAIAFVLKNVDYHHLLVKFVSLQHVVKVSGYFADFWHYLSSYYVAGVVLFLLVSGMSAMATFLPCLSLWQVAVQVFCSQYLQIIGIVVFVAAMILIGIFAVFAALVVLIQIAVQNYVRQRELALIADEYVVKDLAASGKDVCSAVLQQDVENAKATTPRDEQPHQAEMQQRVEDELRAVFGAGLPGFAKLGERIAGYGGTEGG